MADYRVWKIDRTQQKRQEPVQPNSSSYASVFGTDRFTPSMSFDNPANDPDLQVHLSQTKNVDQLNRRVMGDAA